MLRTPIYILTLLLFIISCNKDDDSPDNYIEINGTKHGLNTSHIVYLPRINDVGDLNHHYQIRLYGENYQILFDSEGRYYSERGNDLFITISLESKQAITIENTFYQNRIGTLRDTNIANEYSSFSLFNFEGRAYSPNYLTKAKPIYMAMENRVLELRAEDYVIYSGFTANDSSAITINLYYKGRYHYSD